MIEESIVIHYCRCIEDNPESYNALLDEAERINEEVSKATKLYLEENHLKSTDFSAVIRVTRNGNPRVKYWCSHRSPGITGLYTNYREMVSPYFEQYWTKFGEIHDEFSQHTPDLPTEK